MIHKLKTHPTYFASMKVGKKNFECRKDDRGFKVSDELILEEYDPVKQNFTGKILHRRITYILRNFEGLKEGYCVLQTEKI